ncbi:GNAT family N-acetyltransferase [Acinetobacter sp.]|uniref:GNAT family N-acetyltransferase n=1 Tax=Acinetobacter sp. TaxID=472 RepID=UPI003890349E
MIKNLSIAEVCKIAITNQLFVGGWCMRGEMKAPSFIRAASLFVDEEKPVGVAIVTEYYYVQVFVRKSHRRRGIGRALITDLRKQLGHCAKSLDAGKGNAASVKFWEALEMKRWDLE